MLNQQLREDLEQIVGLDEFFGRIKQAVIRHSDRQTDKDLAVSAKQRQGIYKTPSEKKSAKKNMGA